MEDEKMESKTAQGQKAPTKHALLGGLLWAAIMAVFWVMLIGELSSAEALQPIYAVREYPEITIISVYAERRKSITVSLRKGGTHTLQIGPKTWIIKDNNPGTFEDLQAGQRVRVWYIPRGSQAVIIHILRPIGSSAPAAGRSAESGATSQNPSECTKTNNKQVLVDIFRDLVHNQVHGTQRRLLREGNGRSNATLYGQPGHRAERDEKNLGIDKRNFSVQALDESLVAPTNANVAGAPRNSSISSLLARARQEPVTFHLYWRPEGSKSQCQAAFSILQNPKDKKLSLVEVRLLSLRLPENESVDAKLIASIGTILKELAFERVRVLPNGCLVRSRPPR